MRSREKDESESQLIPKGSSVRNTFYSNACILILSSSLIVIIVCLIYFRGDDNSEANCITPFGTVLGQDASNVIGYSNCNDKYTGSESNFVNEDVYSGLRWQCVEYSRRWLIETKQVTFQSVDIAAQIWDLSAVTKVGTTESLPFESYSNRLTSHAPEIGCLLIYNTDLAPTGHVAVIVGIDLVSNVVLIGEQNWSNNYWLGSNYARNISLLTNASGYYEIQDEYLIGWKCVKY